MEQPNRRTYSSKTKADSEHGVGLVELALILPVIILIIAGGVDIANIIKNKSKIATISRNVGNTVFRDCALKADLSSSDSVVRPKMEACINQSLSTYFSNISALIDTTQMQVSVSMLRRPGGGTSEINLYHSITTSSGSIAHSAFPRIASAQNLYTDELRMLNGQGLLLFAEVSFNYVPLVTGGGLFGLINPFNLYEISVY